MNALELAQARAAAVLANRARMPIVSAFVDELRKVFPDARVKYATEAGHQVGKPSEGVQASDSSPHISRKTRGKK